VGSFGERLQREREMRGITLEEIAEATKIGTRSLRALEQQDFDKLPGGIFNKGFVRAYARYLGLDEEQAVADYLAALAEATAAGKATRLEAAAPEHNMLVSEDEESQPIRLPLGLIAVVVVVAVLLFSGWRYLSRNGLPKLRHVRAADSPRSAANPPPSAPDSAPSVANPLVTEDGFVVRVKSKEDSWMSIVADGKEVMSGVLPKAAEKSIHARQSVVLKTGNAAGIELFHNDKPVPSLGGGGEVKTVEFTAAGLRQ
jgi:cytoskeleton protein RodZ